MKVVSYFLFIALSIATICNLSTLADGTQLIALVILIGSIGIMERLDKILKHEKKILKELRCDNNEKKDAND